MHVTTQVAKDELAKLIAHPSLGKSWDWKGNLYPKKSRGIYIYIYIYTYMYIYICALAADNVFVVRVSFHIPPF